ncbi:kelch-like protein 15 [Ciona intestinalis]
MKKNDHAAILFREMSKFQQVGILCDIVVPGKIKVEPAHRIVLLSARSCDADSSSEDESFTSSTSESISVEDAYLPLDNVTPNNLQHKSVNDSLQQRLGNLNEFRLHHHCCDVTLKTESSQHDAHRVVLAACSEYFRAMFTLNMKENNMDCIELKGTDSFYFQKVLEFIYTGEIMLNLIDATEIMHLAVYYQIHELVHSCKEYLLTQLASTNCCNLYRLGKDLGLDSFTRTCLLFIHQHFEELGSNLCDVGLLDKDDLLWCLQSDTLGGGDPDSSSESSVFQVVLGWMEEHVFDLTEQAVNEILNNIRFTLITPEILEKYFNRLKELFPFTEVILTHYNTALKYHCQVHEQPFLQTNKTNLRKTKSSCVCIDGVITQDKVLIPRDFPQHDLINDEVFTSETDSTIRDPYHNVVELNGFIFVFGGTRYYKTGYSSSVLRYDPRLNTWIELSNMKHERGDFIVCVINNEIYVIGGRNRTGALSACEKYNCRDNTWTTIRDLPQGVYMAAGVSYEGNIYVSGGFNDFESLGTMLCYSPVSNTWEEMFSHMMVDRGFHVMVPGHDGKLWVVGGVDNPFAGRNVWEIEAFDTKDKNWLFLGQVLPVEPFQSTLRLNTTRTVDGHISVFSVSKPTSYPPVAYDNTKRMWYQVNASVDSPNIAIDFSFHKI